MAEVGLDGGGELEEDVPAEVGDPEVGNHAVEMLAADQVERVLALLDGRNLEATSGERDGERSTDGRLVVDDEHAHLAS